MSSTDDALAPLTPADDAPLLRAEGLRKSFGAHEVLKGIDFEVRRGEVVVLIGPSGSGKTTVLRSLNGLETPDGGRLAVDGGPDIDFSRPLRQADRFALRDRSAMVFQHHNLFPHLTVLQNVIEGPVRVQKVPKAEAIARADALERDLETLRTDLLVARGEAEGARGEIEKRTADLRQRVSDLEATIAKHEERVVKAYQKIKADEKVREKVRKAIAIAAQLLDEGAPAESPADRERRLSAVVSRD